MTKETQEKKKKDAVTSDSHTLYRKEYPEKKEEQKNGLFKIKPSYVEYRLFLSGFMNKAKELHNILNTLLDAEDNAKLEIRLNSGGGFVNEGIQFYNLITNKFYKKTTTILDNKGFSMGALVFCMGDIRIVHKHSELMFHDYSGGVIGKGGNQADKFEHSQKSIRDFFKEIILSKNFLSKTEFDNMIIGKDYWFNATELLERGIATHIQINGELIEASKYLNDQKS